MDNFNGYLFSKLHLIGSKSEGPRYYLQQFDYKELVVVKNAQPWEADAKLHPFLNKKVTIGGDLNLEGIVYKSIKDFEGEVPPPEHMLELDLQIDDPVWVNKQPPGPQPVQSVDIALLVKWPNRSIWEGVCPTSQIYDFEIEHKGKTIWRWSDDKVFMTVETPVRIPGGSWHSFPESWKLNPKDISAEGKYTLRALFVAAGQEVCKEFEIKFAEKAVAVAIH